jgi:hypothetical protein
MSQADVAEKISKDGQELFLTSIREDSLGRKVSVNGLALIDDQGAMVLADSATLDQTPASDAANLVMQKWEVAL